MFDVALDLLGLFANSQYQDVTVSTNGFLTLPGPSNFIDAGCCVGDVYGFLGGAPFLAVGWNDLTTTVYQHNTPGMTSFTWAGILNNSGNAVLFQALLYDTGNITYAYDSFAPNLVLDQDVLIGVTPGRDAINPGSSDLVARSPINFKLSPTAYQFLYDTSLDDPPGTQPSPVFDGLNIRFESPSEVPEPGTWLLSAMALGSLALIRRFR